MDLLISVDTSLIHIASAVGTNVIGIYANSPRFIKGYPPRFIKYKIVTQKEESKKDYELHNFEIKDIFKALDEIL